MAFSFLKMPMRHKLLKGPFTRSSSRLQSNRRGDPSSIRRFGLGLRRRTTRSAVNPSTRGLFDPVLNDDLLAVGAHEVLAARGFANTRRTAMRTCFACHNRRPMYHIFADVNKSCRSYWPPEGVNIQPYMNSFQRAGFGNFRRGLISSPRSRPRRKSKSQPSCAWRMCSRYIFPYPRE